MKPLTILIARLKWQGRYGPSPEPVTRCNLYIDLARTFINKFLDILLMFFGTRIDFNEGIWLNIALFAPNSFSVCTSRSEIAMRPGSPQKMWRSSKTEILSPNVSVFHKSKLY